MSRHVPIDQGSYVAPAFEHATARDAMRHGVVSCAPDTPAVDVARMMASRHIHAVVVSGIWEQPDHGERLVWGVVSDADLLRRTGDRLDDLTAADLAGSEPLTVTPETPLPEAARLMAEHHVTHVIVADGQQPAGVLSTLDIAGVIAWGRA